jgi:CPA2 family monovalent cation:H+ antiporter-2
MLALPLLAGQAATAGEVAWILGRSAAVIVLVVAGARVVFPWVTARMVATGSRELFTLTTVLAAVGTALVFGHFGLSLALGAFLAGMVVSESEYVGRMVDDITPLRDLFNSLFFVSIGMLVEPRLWLERPLPSLGLAVAVLGLKLLVAAGVALPLVPSRTAALAVGLGLAQVGEFSLVVAAEALRLGLLDPRQHELLLAVAVPTLVLTPFVLRAGSTLVQRRAATSAPVQALDLTGHVVIVGYGINGRNVARAMGLLGVPHVVVDLNPHTIHEVRQAGGHALEGDARRPDVLRAAGIEHSRALVAAVADAATTRAVVAEARGLNAEATIIARTRFLQEVEALHELGADQVIPEELETSLELMARVLRLYGAPPFVVAREKEALRRERYGLLLGDRDDEHPALATLCRVPGVVRATLDPGSPAVGRTLAGLELRRRTGATVVAVDRLGELQMSPPPDLCLKTGDGLVLIGDATALEAASELLGVPVAESPSTA